MHRLNRLLQRLADSDLDFVIVGGFAAMLHGSSMLTRDLAICKEAVARPKDLQAAAELRAIRDIRTDPSGFEPRPPPE